MTEKENKRNAFVSIVNEKLIDFKKRRVEKKNKATFFRVAIIGFSFLTTICVGVNIQSIAQPLKIIALLASALVTSVSAIEAFKNPHSIYVQYTKTVSQLYDIQCELKYRFTGSPDTWGESELDLLFSRYMSIMAEVRECWLNVKTMDKNKKDVTGVSDTKQLS